MAKTLDFLVRALVASTSFELLEAYGVPFLLHERQHKIKVVLGEAGHIPAEDLILSPLPGSQPHSARGELVCKRDPRRQGAS